MILFSVISGPDELEIDGAGGLFYWTPARVGDENITISVSEMYNGNTTTVYETLQAVVDDNTITYPLWRDYRTETSAIPVLGRAHGTDFVSYTLSSHENNQGKKAKKNTRSPGSAF